MNTKILAVLGVFIFLFVLSFFRKNIQKALSIDEKEKEYAIIQEHLLNGSPLYGGNRPKLWIHSKYEINARKWKSFQSRNTTELNQPFLYLTIQSIVYHCSDDFHICLIDDNSFSRLIPSWNSYPAIDTLTSSQKNAMREIGLLKLLHMYGGIVVPDAFVCKRNLIELYDQGVRGKKPFVCEKYNHTLNIVREKQQDDAGKLSAIFLPDTYFMGCRRKDSVILEWAEQIQRVVFGVNNLSDGGDGDLKKITHFTAEFDFVGLIQWWLKDAVNGGRMNLIDGKWIGIKTQKGKPLLMEDLLGEAELNIIPLVFGIYIPADDILRRTNYQWFSVLSIDEIINSRMIIAKYLIECNENEKQLPAFSLERNVAVEATSNHSVIRL